MLLKEPHVIPNINLHTAADKNLGQANVTSSFAEHIFENRSRQIEEYITGGPSAHKKF